MKEARQIHKGKRVSNIRGRSLFPEPSTRRYRCVTTDKSTAGKILYFLNLHQPIRYTASLRICTPASRRPNPSTLASCTTKFKTHTSKSAQRISHIHPKSPPHPIPAPPCMTQTSRHQQHNWSSRIYASYRNIVNSAELSVYFVCYT